MIDKEVRELINSIMMAQSKAINDLRDRVSALEAKLSQAQKPPSVQTGGSSSILSSGELWKMRQKREAKEALASQVKNGACLEVAAGVIWKDEKQRQRYVQLRQEIKAITEKIAKS